MTANEIQTLDFLPCYRSAQEIVDAHLRHVGQVIVTQSATSLRLLAEDTSETVHATGPGRLDVHDRDGNRIAFAVLDEDEGQEFLAFVRELADD